MGAGATCIIGAGSSGIPVLKAFVDRGLEVDCFEATDKVGGLWAFRTRAGKTAAYRSLHINTSRGRMQYADYPMPADYPDFPHHSQIAAYFDDYVERFGLRRHVTFCTRVEHVEPLADRGFRVRLSTGEEREYGFVVVANGHHWDPRWPEPRPPGEFAGRELHSHDYVDPHDPVELAGKRVLVVGFGNSAMDIASEVGSRIHDSRVFLSTRRGGWVVPKYLLGRPLDARPVPPWVPFAARRWLYERLHRLAVGPMERYGLPRPDHRIGHAHPTISADILDRLGAGDVVPKPDIAALAGDRVRFTDGTEEPIDVIVWCTGYRISFPFFDPSFFAAPDNEVSLYLRVWPPGRTDLAFVGLVQPLGAIMPIAELQAKVLADRVDGRFALPSREAMEAEIRATHRAMAERYVASRRHTIQVDFDDYMRDLRREWRRGRLRARLGSLAGALRRA